MELAWKFVKTVSRLNPDWRANVKQFENFHKKEHYYSPVPLIAEVRRAEKSIFDRRLRKLPGVDLNVEEQLRTLDAVTSFYAELPFPEQKNHTRRFHLDNKFYPYTDAIFFYGMMRQFKPKRIIEVGSGFSSAVCLDINERFFDNSMECTFIEPDPVRLHALLRDNDRDRVRIKPQAVQEVPVEEFSRLEANDILFVDSSHVAKIGSDVNYLLFDVLPALKAGVLIHFHDIFYPFEYPREWIYRGVAWNEAYALRAFLQFNGSFRIVVWPDYLERFHASEIAVSMPLCRSNSGSIWLRRI